MRKLPAACYTYPAINHHETILLDSSVRTMPPSHQTMPSPAPHRFLSAVPEEILPYFTKAAEVGCLHPLLLPSETFLSTHGHDHGQFCCSLLTTILTCVQAYLAEHDAVTAVAAALARISGHIEVRSRSLVSGTEGLTALRMEYRDEIRSPSLVYAAIHAPPLASHAPSTAPGCLASPTLLVGLPTA